MRICTRSTEYYPRSARRPISMTRGRQYKYQSIKKWYNLYNYGNRNFPL